MATWKLAPDTGQVSGSHSDMPLVVIPSDITGVGSITLAEAQSSRFYTDAGLVTETSREVVAADELHFKGPSVSSSSEFWWDYDGVRSDYAVTDTYGRNAVWADYVGVWHDMGDDSTSGGNNGSGTGGLAIGGITGKIGDATNFDGVNDYVEYGDSTEFEFSSGQSFTISLWRKGLPDDEENGFVTKGYDTASQDTPWYLARTSVDGTFEMLLRASNGDTAVATTPTSFSDNTWRYYKSVYDAGDAELRLYVDGSLEDTVISVTEAAYGTNARPLSVGRHFTNRYGEFQADEMRIYASVPSADWITTEYNNQNGAFWVATSATPPAATARNAIFAFAGM